MRNSLQLAVLASSPAALVGIWNLGAQVSRADPDGVPQLELLERLGIAGRDGGVLEAFLVGGLFFVPLLATSAAVSRLWAEAFARMRGRPLDAGWLYSAWLFTLLLPATMPLHYAALGISVGVLFGSHVFGGAGRYVVSPALLGVVFAGIAYPDLFAADGFIPGARVPTTWSAVAGGGAEAAGGAWSTVLLGREIGALGTTSALACLIGGAYLAARAAVSWRILAGALLGLAVASAVGGALPWHWHLALGSFAFALAFVASDPSLRPETRAGGWAFGALFGALTVLLRVANPEHPEGTLAALLLAMLCVPLLDELARAVKRRHQAVGVDG